MPCYLLMRVCSAVTSALAVVAIIIFNASLLGAQIMVGPNVQVSKAREKTMHDEVLIAADPKDPNRLLGGSMMYSDQLNKRWTIVYATFDGGKSWSPTLELNHFSHSGDPACAFGRDGTAYYVSMNFPESNAPSEYELGIYHSNDGGRSWQQPTVLPMRFQSVDREYISVDNTGGRYDGYVYVSGESLLRLLDGKYRNGMALWRSRDGGVTFDGPIKLACSGRRFVFGVGNNYVLSDGTLVMLFGEIREYWREDGSSPGQIPEAEPNKPNMELSVITSSDGGESLTPAVKVSDWYLDVSSGSSVSPSLGVDSSNGPFKDRLYVVWPDARSGRSEILLSYSADKGKSWSKPIIVNDDRPFNAMDPGQGPDDFMPVVAVNRDGVVGVSWYDRRENSDNLGRVVRFSASLDGGETFLPSVRVSEHPNQDSKTLRWPVWATPAGGGSRYRPGGMLNLSLNLYAKHFNGGDTAGLTADAAGVFHPLWIDNRTGLSQVWTATVAVRGSVTRHGSADLAELEEISQKTTLKVTNTSYDRATNTVAVDAALQNVSKETLRAPFKLRVIALQSQLGNLEILNADNKQPGAGAIWDFSSKLKNNMLKPLEISGVRQLIFRVSDLKPFRQGRKVKIGFVNLDARVFGKVDNTPQ